ncbi:hypothetical protein AXF42_Ash012962 [Apostasia shenzhenica]|uniref:Uncharacterized protein n=1 Tax=Apostasia shenzhenica TaxID=1088818 RepID=A0A2I0ARQ8_9ASPA|nr:hypothetical protein AXF42_Ash012962 [Apostasia shenzhenica]
MTRKFGSDSRFRRSFNLISSAEPSRLIDIGNGELRSRAAGTVERRQGSRRQSFEGFPLKSTSSSVLLLSCHRCSILILPRNKWFNGKQLSVISCSIVFVSHLGSIWFQCNLEISIIRC